MVFKILDFKAEGIALGRTSAQLCSLTGGLC